MIILNKIGLSVYVKNAFFEFSAPLHISQKIKF